MNTKNTSETATVPLTPKYLDWGEDTFLGEDPFSHWFTEEYATNGRMSTSYIL